MRRTFTLTALAAVCLTISGDTSEAGLFRARTRQRVRVTTTTVASLPRPSPCATPQVAVQGDGPAAFLASLNGWRAMHGRGPVGWDSRLAAFAASNAGVHQPGSSGGAGQCWAPTGSLSQALSMWVASPPHASILLNATSVIGASPCPTGATCNAR